MIFDRTYFTAAKLSLEPLKDLGISTKLVNKRYIHISYDEYILLKLTKDIDILKVKGRLSFLRKKISVLPDNISVGGYCSFEYTDIADLPKNLSVAGSLFLKDSKVVELRNDLDVGGLIYITKNQLKVIPMKFKTKIRWWNDNYFCGFYGCQPVKNSELWKMIYEK